MRIAILTHPLHSNYGGILQNYALQAVLKQMGHEVVTLDHVRNKVRFSIVVLSTLKTAFLNLIGKGRRRLYPWQSKKKDLYTRINSQAFIDKYIQSTKPVYGYKNLRNKAKEINADAFIVGSDQVWRPKMVGSITNYFFDFLEDDNVKKIAYAASFGVDEWEFTDEQTKRCADLIKHFKAVSTRELSGVDLCAKHLGRNDACCVLDPTMLLEHEDYESLAIAENEHKSEGDMFVYILDRSDSKKKTIEEIANTKNLKPFYVQPKDAIEPKTKPQLEDFIFPPITKWIRAFMDAKIIICDSFHGAVFSIIFNKPFVVFANTKRGNARFETLLKSFGLENRLITEDDWSVVEDEINWSDVNKEKERLKKNSIEFLTKALS